MVRNDGGRAKGGLEPKSGLHSLDRDQRARRHAVALLNGSEHRALRLLRRALPLS
jgi:hypothetical protein